MARNTAYSKGIGLEALQKALAGALGALLLTAGAAYGQTHEVLGSVSEEASGAPLPGVNVVVKGTTVGTITTTSGAYSLNAPSPSDTLVFSFIGFEPQEVPIAGRSTIDVVLGEDVSRLDEVVVVGYGTQQKRDITGAVSRVTSEDLNRVPVTTSFSQALQGQAAGVQVMSSGGETGSPTRVLIRGASSVSSGTEPLWIIDGMPVTADVTGIALSRGGAVSQDPLAAINPNDIESIEVLKDAAATAIYGSRGSNGVIIVTTKSGANQRRGETTVNVQRGFTNLARSPEDLGFVSTDQWLSLVNEARANRAAVEEGGDWQEPVDLAFVNERLEESLAAPLDQFYSTDWFGEALRPGGFTDVNFSSARGFDQADFFVSANYRSDEGVRLGDTFQRLSGRANVNFRPLANLELSTRLTGTYTRNERAPNAGGPGGNDQVAYGGFGHIASQSAYPSTPSSKAAGCGALTPASTSSPPRTAPSSSTTPSSTGSSAASSPPTTSPSSTASRCGARARLTSSRPTTSRGRARSSGSAPTTPTRSISSRRSGTSTTTSTARMLTSSASTRSPSRSAPRRSRSRRSAAYLEGVGLSGTGQQVGVPVTPTRYGAYALGGERYLLAYFSRANYTFRDRYLVGLSLRRDGSSVFTDDYRWGTFAAVSAGWIVSDEAFFNVPKVDFFKLRTSYGETGNQESPQPDHRRLLRRLGPLRRQQPRRHARQHRQCGRDVGDDGGLRRGRRVRAVRGARLRRGRLLPPGRHRHAAPGADPDLLGRRLLLGQHRRPPQRGVRVHARRLPHPHAAVHLADRPQPRHEPERGPRLDRGAGPGRERDQRRHDADADGRLARRLQRGEVRGDPPRRRLRDDLRRRQRAVADGHLRRALAR